jgi:molybdate transport system ATP-binding protein
MEVPLNNSGAAARQGGIVNAHMWRDAPAIRSNRPPLIAIERANVFLERKNVLQNIDWQIRDGENWVIFGRNGAGKSTLLKLAFGDLHAAWGSSIKRFEFTAKNTIWDMRKKVGFVSPELQAKYREELTGAEVIASGFFSSIGLMGRVSAAQKRKVQRLIKSFGLEPVGGKRALQMSYGEFRKMLLLRALVQDPELVICDEPFDGLDANSKSEFSESLDKMAMRGTRLVLVTHHLDDLPSCISHGLVLEKGRIVCQGEMRKLWKHPALNQLFGPGWQGR